MNAAAFDPDARAEFLAAITYYEECKSGLGRRFPFLVESAVQSICENPFRYPKFLPLCSLCLRGKYCLLAKTALQLNSNRGSIFSILSCFRIIS